MRVMGKSAASRRFGRSYPSPEGPPSLWGQTGLTVDIPRDPDHTRKMIALRKQMTAQLAIDLYLKELRKRKRRPQYVSQVRYVLKRLKGMYGPRPLCDLNRHLVGLMLFHAYRGVQPHTYATYSRLFWRFFEWCKSQNFLIY